MNKEELEKQISLLQERVEANKVMNKGYESDLLKAKQDLEDLNKPELEPVVFDQITEAVEDAIDTFSFDDTDNYTFEYEVDYDGRIATNNVEFDTYDIKEKICNAVYKLFKEADAPEDDDSQLNTQTVAEKVI